MMAKRTEVVLIDDIDGSIAEGMVAFSLDGVSYEIDLSSAHAADLRADFGKWIDKARRVGGRRLTGRRPAVAGDISEIRAWALANGHEVSARGRIPGKVREAYNAAH
jgi:hypothetical protein